MAEIYFEHLLVAVFLQQLRMMADSMTMMASARFVHVEVDFVDAALSAILYFPQIAYLEYSSLLRYHFRSDLRSLL